MTATKIPYFEDTDSAMKLGVKVVEREAINAIIYNPRKDEVLCLDWQKFGWKTFVIGGIEAGEDPVVAAEREIVEETGYKDIKLIAEVGKTRSGYYAAHKGENRISNATGLLFELVSDARNDVPDSETLPHVFKWIPRDQVSSFLTPSSQKHIWENAQKKIAETK